MPPPKNESKEIKVQQLRSLFAIVYIFAVEHRAQDEEKNFKTPRGDGC
jgi:hypothetical protein